jgi:hypothetical protein
VLSLITIHPAPPSSSSPESQAVKCSPRTERKAISEALVNDYSVQEDIVSGIMGLFGKTDDKVQKKAEVRSEEEEDVWVPDVERIVREMGKGILQDENVSILFSEIFPRQMLNGESWLAAGGRRMNRVPWPSFCRGGGWKLGMNSEEWWIWRC